MIWTGFKVKCRRCSGCPTSIHHWIENGEFENLDDIAFICAHCDAAGVECPACDEGSVTRYEDDRTYDTGCNLCGGHGVLLIGTVTPEPAVPTHYCDKCGREFVYVNPDCKIDPWPTKTDPSPCGGNILPLPPKPKRGMFDDPLAHE